MSNETQESSLQLLPVHDLEESALTSFNGAHYHLDALRSLLGKPALQILWKDDSKISPDEHSSLQAQVNEFHWHIRGFFWELVSAFDAMLHWSNTRFGLQLREQDVRWKKVALASATIDADVWAQKKMTLQSAWESNWFFEVRQYRNFAHRSFLILQAEYGPHQDDPHGPHRLKFMWLMPARVGQTPVFDVITHISDYIREMGLIGEKLFHR